MWLLQVAAEADPEADPFYGVLGLGHGGYLGYPGYYGYPVYPGYLGGHLGYLQHLAAGPPHSYLQPSFHTSVHHPPAVAVAPAVAPAVAAVEPAGAARIAGLGAVPAVPHSVAARPDTSLHTPAAAPPVAAVAAPAGYIEGVAGRVTSRQYHAQDEEGNYSFGYTNPSSARAEAGNPRTGVQG